jgi:hypothetical protein
MAHLEQLIKYHESLKLAIVILLARVGDWTDDIQKQEVIVSANKAKKLTKRLESLVKSTSRKCSGQEGFKRINFSIMQESMFKINVAIAKAKRMATTSKQAKSFKKSSRGAAALPAQPTLKSVQESSHAAVEVQQIQPKQEFKARATQKCDKCSEAHYLYQCQVFQNLSVAERKSFVQQNKLCFNCLFKGHAVAECKNKLSCKKCNRRQHTLLHFESQGQSSSNQSQPQPAPPVDSESNQNQPVLSSTSSRQQPLNKIVLMGTLLVTADDSAGEKRSVRVFVDPGSDSNFISERCMDLLGLQRKKSCVNVIGIGGSGAMQTTGIVKLRLYSRVRDFSKVITALVIKKITGNLPTAECKANWPHLKRLDLADPTFWQPSQLDILLRAATTPWLILPEIIHGPADSPFAQNANFGWMLSGEVNRSSSNHSVQVILFHSSCSTNNECLQTSLKRFWEIADVESPHHQTQSLGDELAEGIFTSSCKRILCGTYSVDLPFRKPTPDLGYSKAAAVKRFVKVEQRLNCNQEIISEYVKCMRDNLSNKFMELVPSSEVIKYPSSSFSTPHREVIKESISAKVRIVFDASAKSSSGNSLNDCPLT